MKKRYFFKSQSSLQRKAIAGGLTATFVFGTVGSGFAGAMKENQIYQINLEVNKPTIPVGNQEYECKNIKAEDLKCALLAFGNYKVNYEFVKEIDLKFKDLEEKFPKEEEAIEIIKKHRNNLEVWNKKPPSREILIFGVMCYAFTYNTTDDENIGPKFGKTAEDILCNIRKMKYLENYEDSVFEFYLCYFFDLYSEAVSNEGIAEPNSEQNKREEQIAGKISEHSVNVGNPASQITGIQNGKNKKDDNIFLPEDDHNKGNIDKPNSEGDREVLNNGYHIEKVAMMISLMS